MWPFGDSAETDLDMQPTATPSSPAAITTPDAAYRRLAATILGLDVPTLATKLRTQRLCPDQHHPEQVNESSRVLARA